MKNVVLLLFVFCFSISHAQTIELKKKHLKNYTGLIPPYEVNYNNRLEKVEATAITVSLVKDSIYVNVGLSKWSGTYTAIKTSKKTIEISGKMNGSGIKEIIILYPRKRKLIRKGLFPQSDAELKLKKD
jgi:hypothetical protein